MIQKIGGTGREIKEIIITFPVVDIEILIGPATEQDNTRTGNVTVKDIAGEINQASMCGVASEERYCGWCIIDTVVVYLGIPICRLISGIEKETNPVVDNQIVTDPVIVATKMKCIQTIINQIVVGDHRHVARVLVPNGINLVVNNITEEGYLGAVLGRRF